MNLKRASTELFKRSPDERFHSIPELRDFCRGQRQSSADRWFPPKAFVPAGDDVLTLELGTDGIYQLNDWSFGQLCHLAGIQKETVNRLNPSTASLVLRETLPQATKPLQVFTQGNQVRSIHGTGYTRLHNVDLLNLVQEYASDFSPPPPSPINGGTGLYCGEQDMFCFLIDPLCWCELDGQAFAPGFFLWNSEVGKRSLGIQTFWFQKICANHIVWDAVEVVEFTRKHTSSVHESFDEIRRIIERLIAKRDARKDRFYEVVKRAMATKLGKDPEEVQKALSSFSISNKLIKLAVESAQREGAFTIFSLVDALTRLTGEIKYAGDRYALDQQVSAVLALAA